VADPKVRIMCVVTRERILLAGYLVTRLRALHTRSVTVKVDERRSDRRVAIEPRHPDRRSRERRRRPSL